MAVPVWVIGGCQTCFPYHPGIRILLLKIYFQFAKFQESKTLGCTFVADELLNVFLQHFNFAFWSKNVILRLCNFAVEVIKYFWRHFDLVDFRSQPRNFHAAKISCLKVMENLQSDGNIETEKTDRSGFSRKNLLFA